MAMPALKSAPETPVEERVARIEAHTEHMHSDMSEMKLEIRGIRAEMRQSEWRSCASADALKDALLEFKLETERRFTVIERKVSENTRWIIGVGLTVTIAVLGGMSGGFLWLAERIGTL